MAKKRVHEIAKAQGLTSKEVLAALEAAGVEAKAAQSSVEESDALAALKSSGDGGPSTGTATKTKPAAKASATKKAAPKPAAKGDGAKPKAAPKQTARQSKADAPAKSAGEDAATRPQGGDGGGAAKKGPSRKRRRVVIDSQAARRDHIAKTQPPPRPPRRRGGRRRRPLLEEPSDRELKQPEEQPAIKVNSGANVREVAESLGLSPAEVIKALMKEGEMATLTQTLTDESVESIAKQFDRKIEIVTAAQELVEDSEVEEDDEEDLAERPPVVTVMGHVDHGKTSLLDAIRQTQVAAGEAGGITQHIGAYQVQHDGKTLTFLDTPGHEAFTAMRARGAKVTDVAVIVVAADDGVMPQTVEAIDHARAADVPILVAVNKIDKEGADPNRVRTELAGQELNPEEWGGDTVYADVSAKTKDGLDNLLEMILLVTDLEELGANPNAPASGTVVEAELDPGRGPVTGVLVQRGTLRVGDAVVAGPVWGKVRAMLDDKGERIEEATPGTPVEVLGFDGVSEAGEHVQVVENERKARGLAQERETRLKTEQLARRAARKVTLEEVFERAREGQLKEFNIVLKADVSGSLEALEDEIAKLPQEQVPVNVIHAQTGGINESDVMLAAASDAVIIGFNVRPLVEARRAAENEGVDIRTYTVIYKVTEDLRAAMEGLLEPEEVEEALGQAEVKQTFKASRVGTIAGCLVTDGKVARSAGVRLVRDGTIVWSGKVGSLRRFKDDVPEVDEGQECGVVLDGFADIKVGDVLEFFETRQVEKTLE
ncbi:MAG TPA: translation initiation factor IF-2 [Solirubrobacterales bacterium]|jgi:translation initiation factor IF-2|nr:translation initiation factor IF-2 [Solirubrobacterales bacterium]